MSKTLSYDGSLRYWANHTQQLDIKREGEREEGREGGREEGGREEGRRGGREEGRRGGREGGRERGREGGQGPATSPAKRTHQPL